MKNAAQSIINADHQKPAAQQKYADITTITDENYFPIASLERLGTAQDAQFQSGDQQGTGYHWSSRKNAAGEYINADGSNRTANMESWNTGYWTESNLSTEMPRSYNYSIVSEQYYNWYAATAESGTFSMVGEHALDSACPRGWGLPASAASAADGRVSWEGLLNTYSINDGSAESARFVRRAPLMLLNVGGYSPAAGDLTNRLTHGFYWSSYATAKTPDRWAGDLRFQADLVTAPSHGRIWGFAVRCVLNVEQE